MLGTDSKLNKKISGFNAFRIDEINNQNLFWRYFYVQKMIEIEIKVRQKIIIHLQKDMVYY